MVSPAVEGFPHLALQDGPLQRVPLIPEGLGIGFKSLLVVGKSLGVGGDAAGLVPGLEKVVLGLLPVLGFGVVVGKQRIELLQAFGKQGLDD